MNTLNEIISNTKQDETKGTQVCKDCGRELPLDKFAMSPYGSPMKVCKECKAEKFRNTMERKRILKQAKVAVDTPANMTYPEFEGMSPRDVMDLMVRCKLWLEAQDYVINLSGYKTVRQELKFI